MNGVQQISGSNGVINQVQLRGHNGWTSLSLRTGSGQQWSLAKKVGLFFLCACVLILLLRSRVSVNTNHQTTIKRQRASDDLHEKQPNQVSAPTFVRDAGVTTQKTLTFNEQVNSVALNLPATLRIEVVGMDKSTLSITADQNIMELLAATLNAGHLMLHQKPNTSFDTKMPIQYVLTVSRLQNVTVSKKGKVSVSQLNGERFYCNIGDNSLILISGGQLDSQAIIVKGTGKYLAEKLATRLTSVSLQESSTAYIQTPSESLGVILEGNSICYYTGSEPHFSSRNITGNAKLLPKV